MHPAATAVINGLAGTGCPVGVRDQAESAHTAALAAAQPGVQVAVVDQQPVAGAGVGAIANRLISEADGAPLLATTLRAHTAVPVL